MKRDEILETKWTRYYGEEVFTPQIDTSKTLYGAFKDAAQKYSGRIAYEYFGNKITYERMLTFVDDCASRLKLQGVSCGDTVLMSCSGTPYQAILFYAVNKIGAKSVYIPADMSRSEFAKSANELGVKITLLSVDAFMRYREVISKTDIGKIILGKYGDYISFTERFKSCVLKLIPLDRINIEAQRNELKKDIIFWSDIPEPEGVSVEPFEDAEAVSVYFLCGSAAGSANVVSMSSRAMNEEAGISGFLYGRDPVRIYSFIRQSFSFGLSFGLHTALMCGHTVLLYHQTPGVIPHSALNYYSPDVLLGYPRMITSLVENRKVNLSVFRGIKKIFSGGTVMLGGDYHKIVDYFRRRSMDPEIIRIYGFTETASVCMYKPTFIKNERTVGIPLPGVRIKVLNPENLAEQPYDVSGMIAINTPAAMTGYEDSQANTELVMRRMRDDSLWIMSGDLGFVDEQGLFYYNGSRRIFDKGGMPVYPQLIENEIMMVRGVENCCAVPVVRGNDTIIKVAIQPEQEFLFDNDRLNALKDEVEDICRLELTESMLPDEYEFMAYLPIGSFGKVDYEKVLEIFKEEENEQKDPDYIGDDISSRDDV